MGWHCQVSLQHCFFGQTRLDALKIHVVYLFNLRKVVQPWPNFKILVRHLVLQALSWTNLSYVINGIFFLLLFGCSALNKCPDFTWRHDCRWWPQPGVPFLCWSQGAWCAHAAVLPDRHVWGKQGPGCCLTPAPGHCTTHTDTYGEHSAHSHHIYRCANS